MTQQSSDYIALITVMSGGSWARDKDADSAVRRAAKIFHSDWKHLFRLDGETTKVNLFDVSGHDDLWISDSGVQDKKTGKWIPVLRVEEVTLPGKKKKAA